MAAKLEVRKEGDRPRHYLDDRPVRSGQGLEVLLPDGQWLIGAYEWSFRVGEAPRLVLVLGGEWEHATEGADQGAATRPKAQLLLPREAILRWPGSGGDEVQG